MQNEFVAVRVGDHRHKADAVLPERLYDFHPLFLELLYRLSSTFGTASATDVLFFLRFLALGPFP